MRFFFNFIQILNIGFVTQKKVPFRQGRLINGIWGAAFPDRIAFLQQNLIWTIFLKIRPHVFDMLNTELEYSEWRTENRVRSGPYWAILLEEEKKRQLWITKLI